MACGVSKRFLTYANYNHNGLGTALLSRDPRSVNAAGAGASYVLDVGCAGTAPHVSALGCQGLLQGDSLRTDAARAQCPGKRL